MLKLADFDGLTYIMLEEKSADNHVILVQDNSNQKSAKFQLETLQELSNELDFDKRVKAKEFINDFKEEFLDYWNSFKF